MKQTNVMSYSNEDICVTSFVMLLIMISVISCVVLLVVVLLLVHLTRIIFLRTEKEIVVVPDTLGRPIHLLINHRTVLTHLLVMMMIT